MSTTTTISLIYGYDKDKKNYKVLVKDFFPVINTLLDFGKISKIATVDVGEESELIALSTDKLKEDLINESSFITETEFIEFINNVDEKREKGEFDNIQNYYIPFIKVIHNIKETVEYRIKKYTGKYFGLEDEDSTNYDLREVAKTEFNILQFIINYSISKIVELNDNDEILLENVDFNKLIIKVQKES